MQGYAKLWHRKEKKIGLAKGGVGACDAVGWTRKGEVG